MALRKDDPIYYRNKINDLIKQAKENKLMVYVPDNRMYLSFKCIRNGDTCSVNLEELVIEQIPKDCRFYNCSEGTCYNEYDCRAKCPNVTSKFKA
ncbi:hypothetical protein G9F73_012635 [Clostridium estertheticum]|uniref:hypothetical protein n=1 Tax=Clostridium estertheticum TaxID=238834 RepID=UPI0013EE4B3A|nr:hypothetical protein [Clostridium estertheticum]MBZ9608655.1 hypothetical protein [Clostridium estertheticum]